MELSGYEIQEVLGRGGFATVYRARQLAVGREVALKVDSRALASDRDRQRFLREVTAAGQLSGHPHVVPVYDAGVLGDDRPYMVMELCPGGSLGDRLHHHGPLAAKEARDIGLGIADALAAAHAAGVLHRDIKPGNIMVNRYGAAALTDFGLAAMPRPGRELSVTREALTPAYAPPEAFQLAEPTTTGDVYSLAATLYALLRGRPPHHPEDGTQLSLAELIVRHTWPYSDLPGVPHAFNEVLRHALATDPASRMPDAGTLRDALAAVDVDGADRGGFGPAPRTATTVPAYRAAPHTPPGTVPPPPSGPVTADGRRPGRPGGSGGPDTEGGRTAGERGGSAPGGASTVAEPLDRRSSRWRPGLIGVLAAVVTVSVSVTLVIHQYGSPGSPGSSSAGSPTPSVTDKGSPGGDAAFGGVRTTRRGCAAADVEGVGGRCVTTPECWSGITDISGTVTVSRADCHIEHVWETFAIAPLPKDGMTYNARDLAKHPVVRSLCSQQVTRNSLTSTGRADGVRWDVDVLPPTAAQWAEGLRVFRCVAAALTDDGQTTNSHFGADGWRDITPEFLSGETGPPGHRHVRVTPEAPARRGRNRPEPSGDRPDGPGAAQPPPTSPLRDARGGGQQGDRTRHPAGPGQPREHHRRDELQQNQQHGRPTRHRNKDVALVPRCGEHGRQTDQHHDREHGERPRVAGQGPGRGHPGHEFRREAQNGRRAVVGSPRRGISNSGIGHRETIPRTAPDHQRSVAPPHIADRLRTHGISKNWILYTVATNGPGSEATWTSSIPK
ncbi:protein kinase domain-containing protein [Streptomyces sp. NPDC005046]